MNKNTVATFLGGVLAGIVLCLTVALGVTTSYLVDDARATLNSIASTQAIRDVYTSRRDAPGPERVSLSSVESVLMDWSLKDRAGVTPIAEDDLESRKAESQENLDALTRAREEDRASGRRSLSRVAPLVFHATGSTYSGGWASDPLITLWLLDIAHSQPRGGADAMLASLSRVIETILTPFGLLPRHTELAEIQTR